MKIVSAEKTDLAPYGLDKPGIVVKAKLKSGADAGHSHRFRESQKDVQLRQSARTPMKCF